jgi:asparagine synthetase B (glutamine-hydrolysing)
MSKICGLISNDSNIQVPALFDQMYEASWHSCYQRREVWSDNLAGLGHLGIGAINTEQQPIVDGASGATAVFCGKIFDYDVKRQSLAEEGVSYQWQGNDGEFLSHWTSRREMSTLREVNGIFSLAVWHPAERKLLLTGDRYGFRPLYYYHDKQRGIVAFSSDLRGVLAAGLSSLKVNWRAVNSFLHLGHPLGEDTLFEGVYRLPPASVMTFQNNRVHISRYWSLTELPVQQSMTVDEAIDGCVDLFRQAIKRRIKTPSVNHMLLLSGGQDSRHIAAELKQQGLDFTAYTTTGFKPTIEDKILASTLAQALDIPHVYVPLPKDGFLTYYWPRAHAQVDYEVDLHEWILPLVDALPSEPHINFDGIVGDTCLSSVFLKPREYQLAREGQLDQLIRGLVEREHWPPIFHPSIARHLNREFLYDSIREQFEPFAGHPNLINFAYMSMRTTRAISLFAFKMVIQKAESFYPFADNDYFNFAMSIPPEFKLDGKLHRKVLDRAYPDLRGVPTTKEINRQDYKSDEINYLAQKRHYLRQGLGQMLQGKLSIYSRRAAMPRLLRDIAKASFGRDDRFFLCNPANAVLAEWFDRYFPDGFD